MESRILEFGLNLQDRTERSCFRIIGLAPLGGEEGEEEEGD